jgi:hypothetical protein
MCASMLKTNPEALFCPKNIESSKKLVPQQNKTHQQNNIVKYLPHYDS